MPLTRILKVKPKTGYNSDKNGHKSGLKSDQDCHRGLNIPFSVQLWHNPDPIIKGQPKIPLNVIMKLISGH